MDSKTDGPSSDGRMLDGTNIAGFQVRVIILVLTTINIFSAAAMVTRILLDARNSCRQRRMRQSRGLAEMGRIRVHGSSKIDHDQRASGSRSESSKANLVGGAGQDEGSKAWWEMVPAFDMFPLVLATTIVIQGTMLAVVEGKGLRMSPFQGNCRYLSEVAWVALWMTPYIILSFIIETAIRALSQPRFQPRSGRSIIYCILAALILTMVTWIPSRIMPEDSSQDFCDGELMSFVDQFSAGGLGIMVALLPITVFMGGVILMHLSKGVAIDRVERMASSRTVYFMLINVFQWIMMVPNYVLTAQERPEYSTSALATVIANIGGIIAAGFYIYLRTTVRNMSAELDDEGEGEDHGSRPTIMSLEKRRRTHSSGGGSRHPTALEKELSIMVSEPRGSSFVYGRDDRSLSMNSRPPLASIISEYYDMHTISEIPLSPTMSTRSERETTSILRTPISPTSPTSQYSRDHRSSRAPSIFSQYTTHSFRRLGDEINHMIAGLRNQPTPSRDTTATPPPPSSGTRGRSTTNYSIFPPNIDRPPTATSSTASAPKSQVPRTLLRAPTRPSRAAVPSINLDRRQSNFKDLPSRAPSAHSSRSGSLRVPPKMRGGAQFEVAIPPRQDNGDAESFMEILMWKKETGAGAADPGNRL